MDLSQYLSLAGMALQVEFGDFSHDIHSQDYFDLDHYLPSHVIKVDNAETLRKSLVKLHKAYLGQSQSKTEVKFCKQIQRHDNYGFHFFKVMADKKKSTSRRNQSVHCRRISSATGSVPPLDMAPTPSRTASKTARWATGDKLCASPLHHLSSTG